MDIKLNIFLIDVPIARYKCRRKSKINTKNIDLTFSLLPNCLIPYYSATIGTFLYILIESIHKNKSFDIISNKLHEKINDNRFNNNQRSIRRYMKLFQQTVLKIKLFWKDGYCKPPPGYLSFFSYSYLNYILSFKLKYLLSGLTAFSDYYYLKQRQLYNNTRFLIGTAYQFI